MVTNSAATLYSAAGFSRTVIPAVMWQETDALAIKKYGAESADSVSILIPKCKEPVFTIKKGDLIVKGEVDFEPDGSKGHKLADLMALHKTYKIMHLSDKSYGSEGMQHFEVIAR